MDNLILILAGAFIGWNLPQPGWAKWMQAKAISIFSKIKQKLIKNEKTEKNKNEKGKMKNEIKYEK